MTRYRHKYEKQGPSHTSIITILCSDTCELIYDYDVVLRFDLILYKLFKRIQGGKY